MKTIIVFHVADEAFTPRSVINPMKVGDLRDFLEDYDENDVVVIAIDGGVAYGTLRGRDFLEEFA